LLFQKPTPRPRGAKREQGIRHVSQRWAIEEVVMLGLGRCVARLAPGHCEEQDQGQGAGFHRDRSIVLYSCGGYILATGKIMVVSQKNA